MNVKVTKVEYLNLPISMEEQKRITKQTLLQLIGLENFDADLVDGNVIFWEEDHHNGHPYKNFLRAATEKDKAVFHVVSLLEKAKL